MRVLPGKGVGAGGLAGICAIASCVLAQAQDTPPGVPSIWHSSAVRQAAVKIVPAKVGASALPPDLEAQRTKSAPGLVVEGAFADGGKTEVRQIEQTRYSLRIRNGAYENWFIVRVKNVPAGGAIVRFDLRVQDGSKLTTFNPVYSYTTDLADASAYAPVAATQPAVLLKANNGANYPDDAKQPWRFIGDVWRSAPNTLSFVSRFEKDAYVALRVPYGLGYHEQFLQSLQGNPLVTVHRLDQGRPNLAAPAIIEIGAADPTVRAARPCMVIYSREDGDQQDGSWLIEGAVRFLISATDQAKSVRENCTFLLIPVIDPSAVRENRWTFDAMTFGVPKPRPLVTAYAEFFKAWVHAGKRVDMAIDLFTPESADTPHLGYAPILADVSLNQDYCKWLGGIFADTKLFRFVGTPSSNDKAAMSERLIGYLRDTYGTAPLTFFVNSQDQTRHLSLDELRRMGEIFTTAASEFMNQPEAARLLKSSDNRRTQAIKDGK